MRRDSTVFLLILACAWPCGCRRAPATPEEEGPGGGPAPAPPARAPSSWPTGGAVLQGTVRHRGPVLPQSTVVPVGADPEHCGRQRSLEDCEIDPASRGVRHCLARLDGPGLEQHARGRQEHLVLDNRGCRFEPHAAVLVVGSTLELTNSDPIAHTVHAYHAAEWNVQLAPRGGRLRQVLWRPGLVQLRCDYHGWMNAFIRVDPHPFHAVSDAQGRFRIAGVPPGRYRLETWHERLGLRETTVQLDEGRTAEVIIEYTGQ